MLDAQNVLANILGERCPRKISRRCLAAVAFAHHEAVDAERLAIEEHALMQAERFVERLVRARFVERLGVDSELAHEVGGDFAVGPRAFDGQRAAVHQMHAAVDVELVALGVAAEVVVIVEDQHAAAR